MTFCLWHMFAITVSSYATGLESAVAEKLHTHLLATGRCRTSPEHTSPASEAFWVRLGYCNANPVDAFRAPRYVGRLIYPYVAPYLTVTKMNQRWHMFAPGPPTYTNIIVFEVQEEDGTWRPFTVYAPEAFASMKRVYMLQITRDFFGRPELLSLVERLAHIECTKKSIAPGRNVRVRKRAYMLPTDKNTLSPSWWKQNWSQQWHDSIDLHTVCRPPL